MIRLIVTDVDGTLISDAGGRMKLNPLYFQLIQNYKKCGIYFAVASGRQQSSIAELFEPVKDDIIYICDNGSYVTWEGKELLYEPMTKYNSEQLVLDTRKIPHAESMYCTRDICYFETKDVDCFELMSEKYKFRCEMVDDLLLLEEPCLKYSLYLPEHVEEITSKEFVPKWSVDHQVACGGQYFMDVMSPNANKGIAVKHIQELLGVTKEETMSFGDNLNDLEMLAESAYSVAIGNARQEIKDAARYITDTNKNDGVLKMLMNLEAYA